ncbi:hypothetical protein D9757_011242 [Collybiopsis confluens]|uniref:Uncharacterized protein n=1 Tax=Collybiopsis confluens TaxID=2823264 RepID=A0A8H5GNH6_9AGAR|nr:hypothetical protein D9757_011242 [Collybiopsis confluens]
MPAHNQNQNLSLARRAPHLFPQKHSHRKKPFVFQRSPLSNIMNSPNSPAKSSNQDSALVKASPRKSAKKRSELTSPVLNRSSSPAEDGSSDMELTGDLPSHNHSFAESSSRSLSPSTTPHAQSGDSPCWDPPQSPSELDFRPRGTSTPVDGSDSDREQAAPPSSVSRRNTSFNRPLRDSPVFKPPPRLEPVVDSLTRSPKPASSPSRARSPSYAIAPFSPDPSVSQLDESIRSEYFNLERVTAQFEQMQAKLVETEAEAVGLREKVAELTHRVVELMHGMELGKKDVERETQQRALVSANHTSEMSAKDAKHALEMQAADAKHASEMSKHASEMSAKDAQHALETQGKDAQMSVKDAKHALEMQAKEYKMELQSRDLKHASEMHTQVMLSKESQHRAEILKLEQKLKDMEMALNSQQYAKEQPKQ